MAAVFALAIAIGAPAASAQEVPVPSPATLVEEVDVIARLPGPAMWRVSTSTSQIWFIAGPETGVPKDFHWDDRRLATALEGARELVVPPQTKFGVGVVFAALGMRQPLGHTVRGDMPPDLRARWEQAERAVGQDPGHYDHWRPALAAAFLQDDIARRGKWWTQEGVGVQLGALVRKFHVKVRPLASYSGTEFMKSLANTPEAAGQACLGYMADIALASPGDSARAGEAWAKGDLAPGLALSRRASVCIDATPALVALRNRSAADWAKGLKAALTQPGKVVVFADLDTLTRKDGLLDQLKAEGLEVIGPAWQ